MARFIASLLVLSLAMPSSSFLFGGSSCGCSARPACAPVAAPACAPVLAPACGGGFAAPAYPAPAAYPQQSYSAPAPVPLIPSQGGSYAQAPQPQFAPQPQVAPQPQFIPQPQGGSYAQPSFNVPPPPAPQGPSYEVQPSSLQYEQPAAAGETLREVEEEDSDSKPSSTTSAPTPGEVAEPVDIKQLNLTDDEECNSEDLRKIITENIDEDLNSSKRLIQLAAEAKFGGRFDVICSSQDFSYVTNTELFCQHTKETVSCYAYRQL